jgi:DNA-binding MarR family transcriptional regulator
MPLDTAHPDPSSSTGLMLWRVTNAWQRHIRVALAPHDLTHVQYVLLACLTWMTGSVPVTQRDLAEQAGTDVMMTSQVLRALEARRLVVREPHPSDRRAVALSATPDGVRLANEATRAVEAADARYFAALSAEEHDHFLRALQELPR